MKQFRNTIYGLNDNNEIVNIKTGRVKSISTTQTGYQNMCLYYDGKKHTTYVHRFIAEIYMGECPEGYEIDHLDGDITNNDISNLEYVTSTENQYRARNKYSDTRGVNKSNGYYRLYYNNTYIKGSNCKTLEEIKEFKKEYDKKHNPLDNLI